MSRGRNEREDGPLTAKESADPDESSAFFGFQVVALSWSGELSECGEYLGCER